MKRRLARAHARLTMTLSIECEGSMEYNIRCVGEFD